MSWSVRLRIIGWFMLARAFSAVAAVCYKAQRAAAERGGALIPGAPPVPPPP